VLDRVLVIFAPRSGAEIARVLRPGGRLVVATPEPDHLGELVGPLALLRVDPDKQARLAATLGPHLEPAGARIHRERLLLDRAAVAALVGMGPHARHRSREQLTAAVERLAEPVPVTLAVRVGTWRRTADGGVPGEPTARSDEPGVDRLSSEA
jgi:23S rRNA (guanine745-N1)-methyltransferase